VLGKRVRLQKVGPQSAYVAHDAPMPVGTELVLTVDEGLVIRAEVARVREGDSKEGPAGMWLWADAAEQRARAWWDAHVIADDPRIPEPAGGRVRTEAPVATASAPAPAPAPAPEPTNTSRDREAAEQPDQAVEAAAPVQMLAAGDAGDQGLDRSSEQPDEQPDEQPEASAGEPLEASAGEQPEASAGEQPEASAGEQLDDDSDEEDDYAVEIGRAATNAESEFDRARTNDLDEEPLELPLASAQGRQPRGTQVMTAVEIADVLGMPPVLDGDSLLDAADAAGRQREIRTTHVMSAVEVEEVLGSGGAQAPSEPEVRDGGSAGGKGRKRRGRKRR
jgi:hypothetical protein